MLYKEGRLVEDEVLETEGEAVAYVNDNPNQGLQVRKKLRFNVFVMLRTKVSRTQS